MLSNAEVKRLRALDRRKGREESGRFLAEGVRLVEELLDAGIVLRLALLAPSLEDTGRGRELAARLRQLVRTEDVTDSRLREVSSTETPQGVVVEAEIPVHRLDRMDVRDGPVLLLDAIQDPGNLGTIVRSADAFGATLVIALPGTVDPWNPKCVRSAMGSSLRVPIIEATNEEAVAFLRARDFVIFGADAAGDPAAAARRQRVAVVMGNEGAGLGNAMRAACDRFISIPMRGRAESLNVAVAAGILLYLMSGDS